MRCVSDLMEERYFLFPSSPRSSGFCSTFEKVASAVKDVFFSAAQEIIPGSCVLCYSGPFILQKLERKPLKAFGQRVFRPAFCCACREEKCSMFQKWRSTLREIFHLDLRAEHVRYPGFPLAWMKNDFIMHCSLRRFLTNKKNSC